MLRDALLEHADKNDQLQHLLEVQARQHSSPSKVGLSAAGDAGPVRSAGEATHGAGDAAAGDAAEAHQAQVHRLEQKLKESNQKMLLLEEQLRIRSGSDYLGRDAVGELGALPELGLLPPADAWAAVGRGAADRICGAVPHNMADFGIKSRPSLGSLRTYGSVRSSLSEVLDQLKDDGSKQDTDASKDDKVPWRREVSPWRWEVAQDTQGREISPMRSGTYVTSPHQMQHQAMLLQAGRPPPGAMSAGTSSAAAHVQFVQAPTGSAWTTQYSPVTQQRRTSGTPIAHMPGPSRATPPRATPPTPASNTPSGMWTEQPPPIAPALRQGRC